MTTKPGLFCLLALPGLLAGCGGSSLIEERDSGPSEYRDLSQVSNAVPREEPRSRYGNPESYVVHGKRYYVLDSSEDYHERGIASWYGTKFHGRRTSSGERYDMYAMTAAHKSLPLPTYVEVTNLKNNRKVIVKVNDRGPFHENRIIDLSYAAAHKLGINHSGTGLVEVRAINTRETQSVIAANTNAPAVQTTAANKPSAALSLFLQVGAFASRTNAEQLLGRLLEAAVGNVRISQLSNAEQTLYRVRIGPIASVEEADRLAESLDKIGINTGRIVID
ncbi:MAG: septal ring lytic transglycosylase RlpA family protein [Granulosicoccaceae bacterium]